MQTVEGFVVDLACARRYPEGEYTRRASVHTTECALMGHCVESGYALVMDDGFVLPLDTEATPKVVQALGEAPERGARIRMHRQEQDGQMQTRTAQLVGGDSVKER